jgi:hypothetical protein
MSKESPPLLLGGVARDREGRASQPPRSLCARFAQSATRGAARGVEKRAAPGGERERGLNAAVSLRPGVFALIATLSTPARATGWLSHFEPRTSGRSSRFEEAANTGGEPPLLQRGSRARGEPPSDNLPLLTVRPVRAKYKRRGGHRKTAPLAKRKLDFGRAALGPPESLPLHRSTSRFNAD